MLYERKVKSPMHPALQAVLDRETLAEHLYWEAMTARTLPLETIETVKAYTGLSSPEYGFKQLLLIVNEFGDVTDPATWYKAMAIFPPPISG